MRSNTTLPIAVVDLLRVVEPKQVKKMEDIKRRRDMVIDQSRNRCEQHAASAEKNGDTGNLSAIELQMMDEAARAEHAAGRELDTLVSKGGPQYRQIYAHACELLGVAWPLVNPIALPSAPMKEKNGVAA